MANRLEQVLSGVLTIAALVIAVVVVRRELFPGAGLANAIPVAGKAQYDPDWKSMLPAGIRVGEDSAPIKLIEFVDLECSGCRSFHLKTLAAVKTKYGTRLSVTYLHYPLEMHRFARSAAQAGECAAQEGRFAAFIDAAFWKQDSMGLKAWASYARDAGIRDTTRFSLCLKSLAFPRVDSGLAIGARKGLSATPTVFLNGWRFPLSPSSAQLSGAIEDVLAGRKPGQ